jgi:hypothetical protein
MKQWKSKPCGMEGSIWSSASEVCSEVGVTLGDSSRGLSWSAGSGGVIILESAVTGGGGSVSNVTGGGGFAGGRQSAKELATTSTGEASVSGGTEECWRAKIWGLSRGMITKGAGGGSSHSERSSKSVPTPQQSQSNWASSTVSVISRSFKYICMT